MVKLRGKTRAILRAAKVRKGQKPGTRGRTASRIKGLRQKGSGKTARSYHQSTSRKTNRPSDDFR